MQYEAIILEMLSRIKELEDDVRLLKEAQNSDSSNVSQDAGKVLDEADLSIRSEPSVAYKKMTDEMIDICYQCGKKVHYGESAQELADDIASATGMNRNSAIMYLYAVSGMLEGTVYKRAISARAMQKYFDKIYNEYGSEGLRKAVQAAKLHIDYRKECGHPVDSIEEICKRYEHLTIYSNK